MEERLDDAGDNLATQDPTPELHAEPRITFTLFSNTEPLPPGYRLVTLREVHDNREALRRAMPGWEIANLEDGSVDGMSYGGRTRLDRRDDVGHQLATHSATSGTSMEERLDDAGDNLATQDPTPELHAEPRITFTLFSNTEPLPPGYRLVTLREVHDNREALRRAMPGWEIANLEDGSVDGMRYGGRTRLERRDDVGLQLATQSPSPTYAQRGCKLPDRKVTSLRAQRILPAFLAVLVGILIILFMK